MSDTDLTPSEDAHKRIDFRARIPRYLLDEAREIADDDDRSLNGLLVHSLADYVQRRQDNTARLDRPDGPDLVEVTGPWGGQVADYRLNVDGIEVPFIRVYKVEPQTESADFGTRYVLALDDRFQTGELTWDELWKQAWFWANAMAVAAGWTSHGPNARRIARHGGDWAEAGWAAMEQAGCSGAGYGIDVRFTLPSIEGDDQKAYEVKRAVMRTVQDHGGRDPWASLVAYGGLEPDHAAYGEPSVVPAEPLPPALHGDSSARPGPSGGTMSG